MLFCIQKGQKSVDSFLPCSDHYYLRSSLTPLTMFAGIRPCSADVQSFTVHSSMRRKASVVLPAEWVVRTSFSLACLVDIFRNYKCQSGASGRFRFPRPEGLSRTPARKQLSPAGQRKELKRGRIVGEAYFQKSI